jgi:hypothetical protein
MVIFALVCEELYATVDRVVDYSKKLRRQTALGRQQQTTNQLCFMYRETVIFVKAFVKTLSQNTSGNLIGPSTSLQN